MPTLRLVAGDFDRNELGHHVCDGNGFAITTDSEKDVIVTEEVFATAQPILEQERLYKGLNADGSEITE